MLLYNILFSREKWCLPTTIMTRPTRFKFNRGKALSDLFHAYIISRYRESVAGSLIQATGIVEFEDGLRIGNHLKAQNGLQRVHTIPWVRPGALHTPGFLQGQTEFQIAWVWVCMAAWCQARCRVQFLAATVLGLTWPREAGIFILYPDVRQNP